MPPDPEQIYNQGYDALDAGDYRQAMALAGKCLEAAEIDSYWYPAALGLRCWAANYDGDVEQVIGDANHLLSLDSGDDKMWFDAVAVYNLALIRRKVGDIGQSETLFDQARAKLAAYRIHPDRPRQWRLVREFFEVTAQWASLGEFGKLDDLAGRLSVISDPSDEIRQLKKAIDLYQRRARGQDVTEEARQAAEAGVGRTFLALLLI